MKLNEAKVIDSLEFDGLDLAIEVKANGVRKGVNKRGETWENKVTAAYGYIKGTNSPDGEDLDVWVRENPKEGSPVFVVHQLTPDGSRYDEDKVMLGFPTKRAAIAAFKENCFRPSLMFGGVSEFSLDHFKVIAYSARNSKVMISSEQLFSDFVEKGYIKKGIKSPVQLSKKVKESIVKPQIKYTSKLLAESALDLSVDAGANALMSGTTLFFFTKEDLVKFIEHLHTNTSTDTMFGDLTDQIPESFDTILESNLGDAIDDLKSELKVEMEPSEITQLVSNIARDYGLDAADLLRRFEIIVKGPIGDYAGRREAINAHSLSSASNPTEEPNDKDKHKHNERKIDGIPVSEWQNTLMFVARRVITRVGNYIPNGDPIYALKSIANDYNFDYSDLFNNQKLNKLWKAAFKAETGHTDIYAYASELYKDMAADNPDEFPIGADPYEHMVSEDHEFSKLAKLAGVKKMTESRSGTPMVHETREQVAHLTERTKRAYTSFMANRACKKVIEEAVQPLQVNEEADVAFRRFANTVIRNPKVDAQRVLAKVAEACLISDYDLKERITELTGLDVNSFRESLIARKWDGEKISKNQFEDLFEQTEKLWGLTCPDKGTAFKKACSL